MSSRLLARRALGALIIIAAVYATVAWAQSGHRLPLSLRSVAVVQAPPVPEALTLAAKALAQSETGRLPATVSDGKVTVPVLHASYGGIVCENRVCVGVDIHRHQLLKGVSP